MKLRELFESSQNLEDIISSKCKPYLSLPGATSGYLYRGLRRYDSSTFNTATIGGYNIDWKIAVTNRERKPTASSTRLHNAMDQYFQDDFGWKARSQSVFVSGSKRFAFSFGDLYIVIPIGPTGFVWSPKVKDLYATFVDDFQGSDNDVSIGKFMKDVPNFDYQDNNLDKAINSGNEIMLDCDSYLMISDINNPHVMKQVLGF